ncbi:MAG: FAD binding domain-containing protein [Pseudomonadota bacterium]
MIEPAFHAPRTIKEAALLLSDLENAIVVSGGQWLVPRIRSQEIVPNNIIATQHIEELRGIRQNKDRIIIGAAETHNAIATSVVVKTKIPTLASLSSQIGDQQVRNRGTFGGALISDPARADYSLALLGLDGTLKTNRREYQAAEFLKQRHADRLRPDEILMSASFRIPRTGGFEKLAHPAANYAEAGMFVSWFEDGDARLIVSGEHQWPIRLEGVDAALTNGQMNDIADLLGAKFSDDPFFASRLTALVRRLHT